MRLALRPAHDTLLALLEGDEAAEQNSSPSEFEAQYLLGVVSSAQGNVEEGRRRSVLTPLRPWHIRDAYPHVLTTVCVRRYLLANRSNLAALSKRVRGTLTHLRTHGVPEHINETRRVCLAWRCVERSGSEMVLEELCQGSASSRPNRRCCHSCCLVAGRGPDGPLVPCR